MRKSITLCFFALLIILCMAGCKENAPPTKMRNIYESCMSAAENGDFDGFIKFVHYEDERSVSLVEENFYPIVDYTLIGWEKISDELWVVKSTIIEYGQEHGEQFIHFVGIIDGEYKVMLGVHNIPDQLKGDFDLSGYDNPDWIGIDEVIN